jgi:hypothetical protein
LGSDAQERIFNAVDDFYKFLDARDFFKDHEKRQLLGIALVITCDTIGDGNNHKRLETLVRSELALLIVSICGDVLCETKTASNQKAESERRAAADK